MFWCTELLAFWKRDLFPASYEKVEMNAPTYVGPLERANSVTGPEHMFCLVNWTIDKVRNHTTTKRLSVRCSYYVQVGGGGKLTSGMERPVLGT
jgi:hypothetical protein